jgi:DNA-directed RNA polymerase specialized sigma24 family protein
MNREEISSRRGGLAVEAKARRLQALDYKSIDWEGVCKRLGRYASGLAHFFPDVFDGVSIDDLMNETILAFFESENALGWDASRGSLLVFLSGVLRNKLADHRRRHNRRIAGSVDNPKFTHTIQAELTCGMGTQEQLEAKQWVASLREKLSPYKELQDVVTAAESVNGKNNINQQLAKALRTTPTDVTNRRKRIRRILRGNNQFTTR